ncbi:helix-turn-helix domain-containing protein [Bacillaceae bacterium S4-13-58]
MAKKYRFKGEYAEELIKKKFVMDYIAEELKVHKNTVKRYLRGYTPIPATTLATLAALLDKDIKELLEEVIEDGS